MNAESRVEDNSDKQLNPPLLKKPRFVPLKSPRKELEEIIQARKNSSNFPNEGSFIMRVRNYLMMNPNSSSFSEDYTEDLGKCLREYSNSFTVSKGSKAEAETLLNKFPPLRDFFSGAKYDIHSKSKPTCLAILIKNLLRAQNEHHFRSLQLNAR